MATYRVRQENFPLFIFQKLKEKTFKKYQVEHDSTILIVTSKLLAKFYWHLKDVCL